MNTHNTLGQRNLNLDIQKGVYRTAYSNILVQYYKSTKRTECGQGRTQDFIQGGGGEVFLGIGITNKTEEKWNKTEENRYKTQMIKVLLQRSC